MKLKTIIFLLILLARLICSPGQEPFPALDRITPPSPNAAGLGKFGDIPVSLYTGTPNIHVPLYTIEGKRINMPIGLSYHSASVRVDEIAGWTGLGWTLQAGGAITRTTVGRPDDCIDGYLRNHAHMVPEASENMFDIGSWTPPEDPYEKQIFLRNLTKGNYDAEPDIYHYNFNGRSGRFIMDKTGRIFMIPSQKFNITPSSNANGEIISWEIIDESGSRYSFGTGTNHEITHQLGEGQSPYESYISAWYISSIRSANDEDHFIFEYSEYSSTIGYPVPVRLFDGVTEKNATDPFNKKKHVHYQGKTLQSIHWDNGRMDFDTVCLGGFPGGYYNMLSGVKINTSKGIAVRQYDLSYSFFPSVGCGTPQDYLPPCRRPRLDKITEYSGDRTRQKPSWWFFYSDIPIPPRGSYSTDHWGYYNGVPNHHPVPGMRVKNYSSFSDMPPHFLAGRRVDIDELKCINLNIEYASDNEWAIPGANKEINPFYAQAGMLQKIVFPTGAITLLEFEPHDYGYFATPPPREKLWINASYIPDTSDFGTQTRSFAVGHPQSVRLWPVFGIREGSLKDKEGTDDPPSIFNKVWIRKKDMISGEIHEVFTYTCADDIENSAGYGAAIDLWLEAGIYEAGACVYPDDYTRLIVEYIPGNPYDAVYPIIKKHYRDTRIELGYHTWPDDTCTYLSVDINLDEQDYRLIDLQYYFYTTDTDPNYQVKTNPTIQVTSCRLKSLSPSPATVFNRFFIDNYPDSVRYDGRSNRWILQGNSKLLLPAGNYRLEFIPRIKTECGSVEINYKKFSHLDTRDLTGGIRIKKIIQIDSEGDTLGMTEYRYVMYMEPGLPSSGVLMGFPKYFDMPQNILFDPDGSGFSVNRLPLNVYSANTNILSSTQGSHIGYRMVEEIQADSGSILYYFTSACEFPNITPEEFPFSPATTFDWKHGLPLEKTVFDKTGKIRHHESYQYNDLNEDPHRVYVPGIKTVYLRTDDYFPQFQRYLIPAGWTHPEERSTVQYDTEGKRPLVTEESFIYNEDHLQITRMVIKNSDGRITETRFTYPEDTPDNDPAINMLRNKHIINALLEKQVLTDSVLTEGEKIHYDLFNENTMVMPSLFEKWENNRYEPEIEITGYDHRGNILEYHYTGGSVTRIGWDQKGNYPVWKAENSSPHSGSDPDPRDVHITSYSFQPLVGLISVTDPNGMITSLRYDKMGRLDHVTDFEGNIIQHIDYHYKGYYGDTSRVYDSGPGFSYAWPPDTAWANVYSAYAACPVTLQVQGESTGTNGNWYWYKEGCGSVPAGTGPLLTVYPQRSTAYYVRAESKFNITPCKHVDIHVMENILSALPDSLNIHCNGTPVIGETLNLLFSGCGEPIAYSPAEWISLMETTTERLTLKVDPNPADTARNGMILIYGGGKKLIVPVFQEGQPSPMHLQLSFSPDLLKPGDQANITCSVSGGQDPYTFKWEKRFRNEIQWTGIGTFSGIVDPLHSITLTMTSEHLYVRCIVTSAGQSASSVIVIPVMQEDPGL